MLLCEDGRWYQYGNLRAIHDGFERRPNGDLGLAVADIAADQPVHGPFARHILLAGLPGGPLAGRADDEGDWQASGGVAKVNETTMGKVSLAAPVFIDIQTAMLAFAAVTAALYHRERTGEGQKLETSLLQGVMSVQPHAFCQALEKEE